jgi:hypothetical protein
MTMQAIRVHRYIDSETLQLPELRELIGKEVEIVVLEEPAETSSTGRRDYSALDEIAGKDLIDPEAYRENRAASMI